MGLASIFLYQSDLTDASGSRSNARGTPALCKPLANDLFWLGRCSTGPHPPRPHRNVEFSGVSAYEIEQGLFTEARIYYDTGALADQLGLLGQRLPRSERDQ
jgi:hypothetical protein